MPVTFVGGKKREKREKRSGPTLTTRLSSISFTFFFFNSAHRHRKHVGLLSPTSTGRAARSPKASTNPSSVEEELSQVSGPFSSGETDEQRLGTLSISELAYKLT